MPEKSLGKIAPLPRQKHIQAAPFYPKPELRTALRKEYLKLWKDAAPVLEDMDTLEKAAWKLGRRYQGKVMKESKTAVRLQEKAVNLHLKPDMLAMETIQERAQTLGTVCRKVRKIGLAYLSKLPPLKNLYTLKDVKKAAEPPFKNWPKDKPPIKKGEGPEVGKGK